MLEMPKDGWSSIHVGKWTSRCCNDDDIPFALLEALTDICESNQPAAVRFQTDAGGATIVFDFEVTHIILHSTEGYTVSSVDMPCYQLARELISDLRKNLDAWVKWSPSLQNPVLLEQRKLQLEAQCSALDLVAEFYMT